MAHSGHATLLLSLGHVATSKSSSFTKSSVFQSKSVDPHGRTSSFVIKSVDGHDVAGPGPQSGDRERWLPRIRRVGHGEMGFCINYFHHETLK